MLDPDPLSEAAHKIENLVDENSAVTQIRELIEDSCFNYFKIGGVLQVIREEKWLLEHPTFAALCEEEFSFSKRKAEYLIDVYNFCLKADLNWENLKAAGWTKMRLLSRLTEPKEALPWIEKAESTTYKQLQSELKQLQIELQKGAAADGSTGDEGSSPVKHLVFKPHADQCKVIEAAIKKAKKEVSTEFETVALDHICLTYLSPGASTKKPSKDQGAADMAPLVTMEESFRAVLKQHDDDLDATVKMVFEVFAKVFPNIDVDVHIRE